MRFTRLHNPAVMVHVGQQIAAQTSVGACNGAVSNNARVLAPEKLLPPLGTDCTPHQVLFRAVGVGRALLTGQLPCHVPECLAAMGAIPIVVRQR